jgi:hypothetical protein
MTSFRTRSNREASHMTQGRARTRTNIGVASSGGAQAAVGRKLNDQDVIELTSRAAAHIGVKAFELDWRVWEASRGGALPYPSAPA